jgi:hypothetical protein
MNKKQQTTKGVKMNNKMVGMMAALAGLAALTANAQQPGGAAAPAPAKTWVDTLTVKGDLRYRYENITEEDKDDRQRDRLRARLGASAKVNDKVKAEIQLSTGDADPVSQNKTIGNGSQKDDMGLNLAYIDWTVQDGLNVIAGKMKNPFICVSDLIWDADLMPGGAAAKFERPVGPLTLYANGATMWVQERATAPDEDTKLNAGQLAARFQFSDEVYLLVGGSYYTYDNIDGMDVIDWEGKNKTYGNSSQNGTVSGSTTNKAYKMEYNEVETFAKVVAWVGMPLEFYGQYVVNQDAEANDTGWLAGVTLGKAKNVGTWEAGYNYRELEKDAVLGAFTDSDCWGGGTDGRGHKFMARYQIAKNVQLGATYFLNEKPIADSSKTHDYDRLQLDVVASF